MGVSYFQHAEASRDIPNSDSAVKLPQQPRFLSELVVVPLKDGILVDGSEQQHVFKGPAGQTLLPRLISLMDGSRTLIQLEVAFPDIHPRQIRAAISLLFNYGLVEEGTSEKNIPSGSNLETLGFLRRYNSTKRANSSGQEAYDRLSASRVIIFHRGETLQQAEVLKSLLERTGISSVTALARESLGLLCHVADVLKQTLVVSLSFGEKDCEWHKELDDWCAEHRLSWLRAVVDHAKGYMDLGPLFKRPESPCYLCFQEVHSRTSSRNKETFEQGSSSNSDFWIALIAVDITYLLARIGDSDPERDFKRYELNSWQSRALSCVRLPGCPNCRPLAGTCNYGHVDSAIVFEDYVGLRSRPLFSYRARQDQSRKGEALSKQAKRLPNCKHLALKREMPKLDRGTLDMCRNGLTDSVHRIRLDELATILLTTAGIRGFGTGNGNVNRWGATAGNLGSVELFVLVREVEGLPAGLYFYEPHEHSIARFQMRQGALKAEDFIRGVMPTGSREMPAALIVFTGAFHRVAQKYGAFGYRLVNLDAGAALSQLHLVARTLNIRTQTITRWADESLEDQLNLRPFAEQVTAIAALFGGNRYVLTTGFAGPAALAQPQLRAPTSAKPARDFCGMPLDEVLETLYRESRMYNKDPEFNVVSDTARIPAQKFAGRPSERSQTIVPLPPSNVGGRPLGDVLARRRSIRHFGAEPVSLAQLSTMLHYGSVADVRDWQDDHRAAVFLTFFVLARKVNGLNPSVYTYDASNHALHVTRDLVSVNEARELFVQDEFATAPMVLWIVGDLAAACDYQGAFGHRRLLFRAGAAAHRSWMVAMAMGLCGSLIAGLVPGAARQQLGLDGYNKASLLAFAAGHEALPPSRAEVQLREI
jgi:SagB-type dehydrogenase family enzyme